MPGWAGHPVRRRPGDPGRRERALIAREDIVTIHRRLAADQPRDHLDGHAMGRRAEAKAIDDERDHITCQQH
ncbi:hypothetical protein [Parafrankia sp. FMc2]|uniref:hypothetical protein n=1 Tax=Parafrankia sp. FMc2 TaxID=3233196 RepID=UPI0034D3D6DB